MMHYVNQGHMARTVLEVMAFQTGEVLDARGYTWSGACA